MWDSFTPDPPNQVRTPLSREPRLPRSSCTALRLAISLGALIALANVSPVEAQRRPETLVGRHFHSSGFGGPVAKISEVRNELALFAGGRGGWLIDQTFVLGGAGYGLTTGVETGLIDAEDRPVDLTMGYGGLELEYIHDSWSVVHWSLKSLVGGGGASLKDVDGFALEEDGFFVLEPEANLTVNVTEFFRIGVGASYRITHGVELTDFVNADLSGPAASLQLKFGGF